MVSFQPTIFYIEYDPYSFSHNDFLSHSDVEENEARYHVNHVTVLWHSCDVMWLVLVWAQFIYSIMWKGTSLLVKLKNVFSLKILNSVCQKGTHSPHFSVLAVAWKLEFNTLLNMSVLVSCVPLPFAKKENYCNYRYYRNISRIFSPSQL